MAFATEHPVLAHSEYRAVEDVVRVGGRFEVVPTERGTRIDVELPSRLGEVAQGTLSVAAGR